MRIKYFSTSLSFVYISVSLMLLSVLPVKSTPIRHTEDYARHAVGVLKGIFFDYSKERAVNILHEAAERDSIPYAMNALGLVYLEGIGVQKNVTEALHWLREAGKHGIVDAYHNIGAIYKEGKYGISQDYVKAYDAFHQGAYYGSKTCNYDTGYMLYKGLGCKQDYTLAVDFFEVAVNKGHSGAMYMLGLCYRNGYGVKQDEEKGMELLNKAADYGFSPAIEELSRPYPENSSYNVPSSSDGIFCPPLCMPYINNEQNDTTLLKGDYEGCLIVYDWSGKFILKEMPAKMNIRREGNSISGVIYFAESNIPFSAEILDDGTLIFKDTYVRLKERYTRKGVVKYKLDSAKFDIWENKILGDLSLYSLNHREPEKPMYIQLYKNNLNVTRSKYYSITVSPNPFASVLKADFELPNSCNINVRIFDKYGMLVYHQDLGNMEKGKQTIVITPDIKKGYYILNITAGKQTMRTIILKERVE